MARVGLLGGSFNPPHLGHQLVAFWALSSGRVDQVWLVPCDTHAFSKQLESFEHRRAMCELALEPFRDGTVRVSTVEHDVPVEGKTLLMIEALQERHPDTQFCLLMGADLLSETPQWYRFDKIESLVEVIVVGRPGYAPEKDLVELAAVSSTEVRARLKADRDVSHWVPRAVLAYIKSQGLYAAPEAT